MIPPIYEWLNVGLVNIVAGGRLFPFGDAGDSPTYPYVTWQFPTSSAGNYLSESPNIDRDRVQIDCYGKTQQSVIDLAVEVRAVMDTKGYQMARIVHPIDPDTKSFRIQLDYDVWHSR